MTRISFAPSEKLAEVKDELAFAAAAMGFEANSLKIMAHNPAILRGFLALLAPILGPEAALDAGLRQLVAHMASKTAACGYCQAHTAHGAHEKGVAAEKIQALSDYRTSPLFDDGERAALSLAQAAAAIPNGATQQHFEALRVHFSEAEIVEMVALISAFGFLNRWNDTLATPLEESPLSFANAHLVSAGWHIGKHKS